VDDEPMVLRTQGGRPQIGKRIRGSWTPTKEDRFLLELSATCNVSAACRAVRMSVRSAYWRRAKDEAFRAAWAVAVEEGYAQLERVMLERAIAGDRKPVFYHGTEVASVTEYPDRIAMVLYAHHKARSVRLSATMTADEIAEARAKLAKRLALIRARRIAAEGGAAEGGDG